MPPADEARAEDLLVDDPGEQIDQCHAGVVQVVVGPVRGVAGDVAALLGQQPSGPSPARGLIWPDRPVPAGRFVALGSEVVCLQHADVGFALGWSDTVADPAPSLYLPPADLTGIALARDGVELAVTSAPAGGGSWALGDGAGMAANAG